MSNKNKNGVEFSGKFYRITGAPMVLKDGDTIIPYKKAYITKVIYNNPATIVFWSDGTKTVSKVHDGDTYSEETGLTLCVLKWLAGGSNAVKNLINDWTPEQKSFEGPTTVTISDVRKKHKANN